MDVNHSSPRGAYFVVCKGGDDHRHVARVIRLTKDGHAANPYFAEVRRGSCPCCHAEFIRYYEVKHDTHGQDSEEVHV
jgi:hypothetical protein